MADSHAHLKIASKEWEAFLDDLQQTLDHFAVPAQEQAELKAIVNSTRLDIVHRLRARGRHELDGSLELRVRLTNFSTISGTGQKNPG